VARCWEWRRTSALPSCPTCRPSRRRGLPVAIKHLVGRLRARRNDRADHRKLEASFNQAFEAARSGVARAKEIAIDARRFGHLNRQEREFYDDQDGRLRIPSSIIGRQARNGPKTSVIPT